MAAVGERQRENGERPREKRSHGGAAGKRANVFTWATGEGLSGKQADQWRAAHEVDVGAYLNFGPGRLTEVNKGTFLPPKFVPITQAIAEKWNKHYESLGSRTGDSAIDSVRDYVKANFDYWEADDDAKISLTDNEVLFPGTPEFQRALAEKKSPFVIAIRHPTHEPSAGTRRGKNPRFVSLCTSMLRGLLRAARIEQLGPKAVSKAGNQLRPSRAGAEALRLAQNSPGTWERIILQLRRYGWKEYISPDGALYPGVNSVCQNSEKNLGALYQESFVRQAQGHVGAQVQGANLAAKGMAQPSDYWTQHWESKNFRQQNARKLRGEDGRRIRLDQTAEGRGVPAWRWNEDLRTIKQRQDASREGVQFGLQPSSTRGPYRLPETEGFTTEKGFAGRVKPFYNAIPVEKWMDRRTYNGDGWFCDVLDGVGMPLLVPKRVEHVGREDGAVCRPLSFYKDGLDLLGMLALLSHLEYGGEMAALLDPETMQVVGPALDFRAVTQAVPCKKRHFKKFAKVLDKVAARGRLVLTPAGFAFNNAQYLWNGNAERTAELQSRDKAAEARYGIPSRSSNRLNLKRGDGAGRGGEGAQGGEEGEGGEGGGAGLGLDLGGGAGAETRGRGQRRGRAQMEQQEDREEQERARTAPAAFLFEEEDEDEDDYENEEDEDDYEDEDEENEEDEEYDEDEEDEDYEDEEDDEEDE